MTPPERALVDEAPARADEPRAHLPGPLFAGPSPTREVSRRRRSLGRRLFYRAGVPAALGFVRALWATYRVQLVGEEHAGLLDQEARPVILGWWHDQSLVLGYYLQCVAKKRARFIYLVSPSVDGDPVSMALERHGGHVIRGSATRSGIKSLRSMYRVMNQTGGCPVIIPDGPQGPARECKPGAIMLSQLSGVPILPVACSISRSWRLDTWDRLHVPRPFAKVAIAFGEPWVAEAGGLENDLRERSIAMGRTLDRLGELAAAACQ